MHKMFSIAEGQTKVINGKSENKSYLLQILHTKAIAALTQFCDFWVKILWKALIVRKSSAFGLALDFIIIPKWLEPVCVKKDSAFSFNQQLKEKTSLQDDRFITGKDTIITLESRSFFINSLKFKWNFI